MRWFSLPLFLVVFMCAGVNAWAAPEPTDEDTKGASGLPLPRFASLRADEVNLRTGPGTRYPIEWVFVREGLPVEITAEFDIWRRIRDWDGSEGWVHKSALTGKRSGVVIGGTRALRKEADDNAPLVAQVEPGSIGHISSCKKTYCKIKFSNAKGYILRTDIWGTYPNEEFD